LIEIEKSVKTRSFWQISTVCLDFDQELESDESQKAFPMVHSV
jgi:hypothetical protein